MGHDDRETPWPAPHRAYQRSVGGWHSVPTGGCWPQAAPIRPSDYGTPRPDNWRVSPSLDTPTECGVWPSAPTGDDVVCRTLGETRFGPYLDSELKHMMPGVLPNKLFIYARCNIKLD